MFKASRLSGGNVLHTTVLIAFDPSDGQVYGSCAHASAHPSDTSGIARSREIFLADLTSQTGHTSAEVDMLEIPDRDLPAGMIDRIDVTGRKLIMHTRGHRLGRLRA